MSVQVIKVLVPQPVATPRGALWAARMVAVLSHATGAVRRALAAQGRARAERERAGSRATSVGADLPGQLALQRSAVRRLGDAGACSNDQQPVRSSSRGTADSICHANLGGPSPIVLWLTAAQRRMTGRVVPTPPPVPDRVREASRVRAFAETVRRSDPRFAADLFAAADRHELEGTPAV